jgi:hypothetical protein
MKRKSFSKASPVEVGDLQLLTTTTSNGLVIAVTHIYDEAKSWRVIPRLMKLIGGKS